MNLPVHTLITHPVRTAILEHVAKNIRLSPSDLHGLMKRPNLKVIAYHVKVLADDGFLELVDMSERQGGTVHIYSLTPAAVEAIAEWAAAARRLQEAVRFGDSIRRRNGARTLTAS